MIAAIVARRRTALAALAKTGKLTQAQVSTRDARLQAHVKRETAPYKYPRIIDFAAELPKTASGKVKRAQLRAGCPLCAPSPTPATAPERPFFACRRARR